RWSNCCGTARPAPSLFMETRLISPSASSGSSATGTLVPIDSGRIVVHERERAVEVEYHISLRRWFFVATGTVLIAFCVGRFFAVHPPGAFPLPFLVFLWVFLFPVNYFIAALRFPAALRA